MNGSPVLLLWDVDGTLISESRSGRIWYDEAVAWVLRRDEVASPEQTAGLTDYSIVERMLMREGFASSQASVLIPSVLHRLEDLSYENREFIARDRDELPGARSFVESQRKPQFVQALLTGNTRRRAITKLGAFGLDSLFEIRCSAFGDQVSERWRLVEDARERAGLIFYGHEAAIARTRVVVIGDTPADIEAARRTGAVAVAVATGKYGQLELATHQPDLLLEGLEAGRPALERLVSMLT